MGLQSTTSQLMLETPKPIRTAVEGESFLVPLFTMSWSAKIASAPTETDAYNSPSEMKSRCEVGTTM